MSNSPWSAPAKRSGWVAHCSRPRISLHSRRSCRSRLRLHNLRPTLRAWARPEAIGMRETSLRTRPVSLALETAPHDTPDCASGEPSNTGAHRKVRRGQRWQASVGAGEVIGCGRLVTGISLVHPLSDDYGGLAWLRNECRQCCCSPAESKFLTLEKCHTKGRAFVTGVPATAASGSGSLRRKRIRLIPQQTRQS